MLFRSQRELFTVALALWRDPKLRCEGWDAQVLAGKAVVGAGEVEATSASLADMVEQHGQPDKHIHVGSVRLHVWRQVWVGGQRGDLFFIPYAISGARWFEPVVEVSEAAAA